MPEITFLEREQLAGTNRLEMFNKIGIKCSITDFAILTGGVFSDLDGTLDLDERVGYYWTKSEILNGVFVVDFDGDIDYDNARINNNCIRPVLKNVSQLNIPRSSFSFKGDLFYFNYGEYPQKAVDKLYQQWLDAVLNDNSKELSLTGKTYTIDTGKPTIEPTILQEYQYRGKKYVRVKANSCYFREEFTLSNGLVYENDDYVWVEVLPIKWIYDKKNDMGVSDKLLLSGIIFDTFDYNGIFEDTIIKKYMDAYFSKDIIPSINIVKDNSQEKSYNPYNFDFTEVTEEEIIRGSVESNVAVFLHGRSSEGKSARVKQIDPDCEIIYLRNATPDSLNGKSVFNSETNEMIDIPPTWYKKVVDKCEREPDKIHIIFFDEITNALPSIQGMAFNIVLNKEVNGKWKLPENARIVAAGNDLEESKAANEMAEPLFNRFAHVYINTTVDSWLKWASTPDEEYERLDYTPTEKHPKIHPAIYAYIAYKSYSKQDVLRTPYNGKTPNADPRKWEMSSKVLYKTRKPEMLRSLIGEDLTRDFAIFCSRQVISVEDVISGNYTESDLDMDVSEKFSTAVGLSSVTEEHIEVVRDFVMKLGPEICATFDTLWTHGDESRLEKIAELKISEKVKL